MALLDELLGGVLRNMMGGSGGAGSGKAALIQAVLAMLLQGGLGGRQQQGGAPGGGDLGSILGSILGGGQPQPGGAPAGGQPQQGGVPGADLGSILGGLLGGGSGGSGNPGAGGLGNILGGGLGGLGQILDQAGLGDHAKSWVSTGQNMPMSPDQVTQVFGADRMGQLAEASGMSQKDAADQLSQILPQLVDGLTPNGKLPQGDEVSQDDLGQLVSRVLAGSR